MSRKLKYLTIPVTTGKSMFKVKTNPSCQFKVYWTYEYQCYQVDLYINNRQHTKACYETDDLEDACNTANVLAVGHNIIR